MSRRAVLVLGDLNIDVLLPVPVYPQPGGEALTEAPVIQVGGSAANAAFALARLGQPARLVGCLGRDVWADVALNALTGAGVDVRAIQRAAQAPTGLFFIPITPDGERTMLGHRGANIQTRPDALDPALFADAAALHLSGYAFLSSPQREAAWRAIELAEQAGLPLALDTAVYPVLTEPDLFRALLPRLTLCILGRAEAHALGGAQAPVEAAAHLVALGCRKVGLKLGAEGCLIADAEGTTFIPGFKMEVVDTTGAGDAFSAGLILACLQGLSRRAAGLLANALGGLATTGWGAGPTLPDRERVDDYLAACPASDPEQAAALAEARRALAPA